MRRRLDDRWWILIVGSIALGLWTTATVAAAPGSAIVSRASLTGRAKGRARLAFNVRAAAGVKHVVSHHKVRTPQVGLVVMDGAGASMHVALRLG